MRNIIFILIFFPKSLSAQPQLVVGGSYIYQFNLFEKGFKGKIQVLSKITYENRKISYTDTLNYFSTKKGLFYLENNSKTKIDSSFDDLFFDKNVYSRNSKSITTGTGTRVRIFDTTYMYKLDTLIERTFFYPFENLFIYKRHIKSDTNYFYYAKLFDAKKCIKSITMYSRKLKDIPDDSLFYYLKRIKFNEAYRFKYRPVKNDNKISELNYYRLNSENGMELLHSSNKYFYNEYGLVKKIIFVHFGIKEKILGEMLFNYFR